MVLGFMRQGILLTIDEKVIAHAEKIRAQEGTPISRQFEKAYKKQEKLK